MISNPSDETGKCHCRSIAFYLLVPSAAIAVGWCGLNSNPVSAWGNHPIDGWFAPLLAVAFTILFGAGMILYQRLLPMDSIARQLAAMAVSRQPIEKLAETVSIHGPVSSGWNRLLNESILGGRLKALETKVLESSQVRSSKPIERILQVLPDGIAETDSDGRIEFMNRAFATTLGLDPGVDSRSMPLPTLLNSSFEGRQIHELFHHGEQSLPKVIEVERNADGVRRVLRIARYPIETAGDDRVHQAWSVRDVTQLRLADQARNSFLDTATHELRTPLSNIRAYAETLATQTFDNSDESKQFCNIITQEASRLNRFIDELLDISSIEAGALSALRQPIEVTRLLQEIVVNARPLMEHKQIRFHAVISDSLPNLDLDKEKLTTCLMNLLGNAAKYTPQGGEVRFIACVSAGRLQVEVADNGIGIAEEEQPEIFEKFYRSQDSRVLKENGSGLGLAYVREVVGLHGGTIEVTSHLNQGSRFVVHLPIPEGVMAHV